MVGSTLVRGPATSTPRSTARPPPPPSKLVARPPPPGEPRVRRSMKPCELPTPRSNSPPASASAHARHPRHVDHGVGFFATKCRVMDELPLSPNFGGGPPPIGGGGKLQQF